MNNVVMGRNIDNYEIIFLLVMYLLLVDRVSLKDRQLSLRVNSEGEMELQKRNKYFLAPHDVFPSILIPVLRRTQLLYILLSLLRHGKITMQAPKLKE